MIGRVGPVAQPILIGFDGKHKQGSRTSGSDWGDENGTVEAELAKFLDNFESSQAMETRKPASGPPHQPYSGNLNNFASPIPKLGTARPVGLRQQGVQGTTFRPQGVPFQPQQHPFRANAPPVQTFQGPQNPRPNFPAANNYNRPVLNNSQFVPPSSQVFRAPSPRLPVSNYPTSSQCVRPPLQNGNRFQGPSPSQTIRFPNQSLGSSQRPAGTPDLTQGQSDDIQKLKNELMENEFIHIGQTKMLRDQIAKKEEDLAKLRRERDEAVDACRKETAKHQDEIKTARERYESEMQFKNLELEQISSKLHKCAVKHITEFVSDGAGPSRKRPVEPQPSDGFPNARTFHADGSAQKKPKIKPPEIFIPTVKDVVDVALQTDLPAIASLPAVPNIVPIKPRPLPLEHTASFFAKSPGQPNLEAFQTIHYLNDSRPDVDDRFTLAVLLQPLPRYEASSAGFNAEVKISLNNHLRQPNNVIKGTFSTVHTESTPEQSNHQASHLIAQEAIALFMTHNRENKPDEKTPYTVLLGTLIPVLANHLRLYVSFLHNLSELACAGSENSIADVSADLGETSLTLFFKTLLVSPSPVAMEFVAKLERNAKLALILMRKLLDIFPELHRFFMKDASETDALCLQLAGALTTLKPLQNMAGVIEPDHVVSDLTWQQIKDQIVGRRHTSQKVVDKAMGKLVEITENLKDVSALRLLLMLIDPMQFKIFQEDVLVLASWTVTSLAASVGVDSAESHEIGSRIISDDILTNYLASAAEETLAPILQLVRILMRWKWFRPQLCSGDNDTCVLLRLYINVFMMPERKVDVMNWIGLHSDLLEFLLEIVLSEDNDIRAFLTTDKHCVSHVISQLIEVLHVYVSVISTRRLLQPDGVLEIPRLIKHFISQSILWIYAMKKKLRDAVWSKHIFLVHDYLRATVVALHDQNLLTFNAEDEYRDTNDVLDKMYVDTAPQAATCEHPSV